jgi:hypothetical protein
MQRNMINEVTKRIYWLGHSEFLINSEQKIITIDDPPKQMVAHHLISFLLSTLISIIYPLKILIEF